MRNVTERSLPNNDLNCPVTRGLFSALPPRLPHPTLIISSSNEACYSDVLILSYQIYKGPEERHRQVTKYSGNNNSH